MKPRTRHPDLFGGLPDEPRPAATTAPRRWPAARPAQAWYAVHFPGLALAAVPAAGPGPRAVHAPAGRDEQVIAADAAALAAGVTPGLTVAAALVRVPGLALVPRDPAAERALLAALAARCTVFTPAVSLASDALLLEVRASLRLFGGAAALAAQLGAALAGHAPQLAAAPTARAALWLARAGRRVYDSGPAALAGLLAGLPVACTGWPADALTLLGQLGIRTLGELNRLPRDGLARRLGAARLRELDEAYGRCPAVHQWYVPPADFHAVAELPADSSAVAELLAACAPLFADLTATLTRRQAGVRQLWCSLRYAGLAERRPPDTRLRLALRAATSDAGHLRRLLELRLAAQPLPAPVAAVALHARLEAGVPAATRDWAGAADGAREPLGTVLDRLRARLGPGGVRGLGLRPDHRPEEAWQWTDDVSPPATGTSTPVAARRPPWLLATPRRLAEADGRPVCQRLGPLALADGPERIETGWWDGNDVRRDYFVAASSGGRRLWVFHDLRAGGWYLHGIFR